jgi:hypothetical protein
MRPSRDVVLARAALEPCKPIATTEADRDGKYGAR